MIQVQICFASTVLKYYPRIIYEKKKTNKKQIILENQSNKLYYSMLIKKIIMFNTVY